MIEDYYLVIEIRYTLGIALGLCAQVDPTQRHPMVQVLVNESRARQLVSVLVIESIIMRCVRVVRSLVNSVVIVLFLTGMLAMILLRTLHRDIIRYKEMESSVRLPLRLPLRLCLSLSLPSRLSPVPRALDSGARAQTRSRD